jgi:hypothetical protein
LVFDARTGDILFDPFRVVGVGVAYPRVSLCSPGAIAVKPLRGLSRRWRWGLLLLNHSGSLRGLSGRLRFQLYPFVGGFDCCNKKKPPDESGGQVFNCLCYSLKFWVLIFIRDR